MTKSSYSFFQVYTQRIILPLLFLLTYTVTFSQTYKWDNVAIGGGGFVSGIITSKTEQNVMFARTDVGGAYRWDATNSKWIPLLDWNSESETGYQGVESIAMDPKASKNVYMLVGTDYFNAGKTAILRSSDYGNTFAVTDVTSKFKAHGNGMGRQNGEKLVVDPNKGSILFCGTRYNGLFKSTDSGASWNNVTTTGSGTPNGNGLSFVLIDPKSGTTGNASQTIFFGISQTNDNFYKSTNGGASFSAVTGGPNLMPQRAVLASDNNMYITYADKEGPWNISNGQIWKYNITTGVWTNVTPTVPTMVAGFGGISVDPNNPNRLIASTTNLYWTQFPDSYGDRFFLSTNGGATWTDLVGNSGITVNPNGCTWITGKSIHWAGCIEFNPFNTAQAYVISGNGIFVCDNVNAATTTWKFLVKGLEETVPLDIVSITGGPLVSVIGDYDGFIHTDVTQYAPIHTPNIGTTTGLAVAALNSSKMVRVGNDMYYTLNQGASAWTKTTSLNGTKGKVALSANGTTLLHCPEGSSTMYRSTNNGSSWSTCNGISIKDAVPVADMVNSSKFYAYSNTSGSVMVSTDGGANFTAASNAGTNGSPIMRTVPGIEGDIWLALYDGGLKHSTNSGTTFTSISNVTTCSAVGLGKAAPSATYHTIYIWGTVGGVKGAFRSIDKGVTWVRINDDAHEYGGPGNGQFIIGDMNVYGRVYMSTVGRGIAYGETTTATCTATITSASTSFCTGGSLLLTASTGTTYKWYKDNVAITGATNSTYAATAAGSYTVDVTNAGSCTATADAKTITATALPTAAITTTAGSFCAGSALSLAASTGTGLTYQWSNAAGTISGATASTYAVNVAGTYKVTVTNTATTCSATSADKTITATALPTAAITTTASSFCAGSALSLAANTGTGLTYQWSNAAGTISGATASTYAATVAGTYKVTVTNTATTCSATSADKTITATALPTAAITTTASSFCAGSALSLAANSGTGLTYQWSNAAGTISGATASTYAANVAGTYKVTVTNSATTCSATSADKTITATALPTAAITTTANSFCAGSALSLAANSGTGLTYQWSNAAGTISGATASTYAVNVAGTYKVTVTNSATTCSATSADKTVTVTNSLTWYEDADGDGKGDPNVTVSSCTQPSGYVSTAGDTCPADPAKTAAGNCGCGKTETSCLDCAGVPNGAAFMDNCSICVGGTTGKNPCITTATINGANTNITVSPQPFQSHTTIKLDNIGKIQSLLIISSAGSIVDSRQDINATEITLGESLSAGMYSVILTTESGVYTTKIVKF
ncbi:T9SS type A sorting domain-containing protein [Cytophaga hutchinsonii]|uniref:CHU large protein candidate xyloglucanase, glycoside hydrolase family 74 protein n=1 Tax=Cytophaga hutchinsonii (strain ATCC 33406 / DSM 1761 / CIP 103989 / NBRC 15051 / NCIMB 9469 / D465) TaxID=269798 RepID=A0A6N4SQ04_CYTH3|nr:T9SS type A sorting domain-containing protein [Cytophaga hutchinsonii]ABG58430.1 CHU large protein; candidate xyloglucanase, glycoside hydrolase family 74 protein [Cytophaga hutchinsonii ATCC 33406]SFX50346.1 Por secretion system C-terminal sorting domain-containing protein [Cytophaga hutchinsonii ATCC 33406]